LHGEGLRLQTTDRGCKSVEQAHDFISTNRTRVAPDGTRKFEQVFAINVPVLLFRYINGLKGNGGPARPPFEVLSAAKRQLLPRLQEEDDPS